jgi:hypothetical protein
MIRSGASTLSISDPSWTIRGDPWRVQEGTGVRKGRKAFGPGAQAPGMVQGPDERKALKGQARFKMRCAGGAGRSPPPGGGAGALAAQGTRRPAAAPEAAPFMVQANEGLKAKKAGAGLFLGRRRPEGPRRHGGPSAFSKGPFQPMPFGGCGERRIFSHGRSCLQGGACLPPLAGRRSGGKAATARGLKASGGGRWMGLSWEKYFTHDVALIIQYIAACVMQGLDFSHKTT